MGMSLKRQDEKLLNKRQGYNRNSYKIEMRLYGTCNKAKGVRKLWNKDHIVKKETEKNCKQGGIMTWKRPHNLIGNIRNRTTSNSEWAKVREREESKGTSTEKTKRK